MPARDRKRPFWSKWVWKDWDAKTRDLSPPEYTAYHRLLSYAATCSEDLCTIPDDDVRLARATGIGLKAWRRVRERVLVFWPSCEGADVPAGSFSTCVDGFPRRFNQRLREDAARFLQLVENAPRRVNGSGPESAPSGTPCIPPRARGSEVRSQKTEETEEESTPSARTARAGRNGTNPDHVPLPEWITAETWADWCAFRRAIRQAPWTVKAASLSVSRLTALRDQGHDPQRVIEQSILNGWRGLFALRPDATNGTDPTPDDGLNRARALLAEKEREREARLAR